MAMLSNGHRGAPGAGSTRPRPWLNAAVVGSTAVLLAGCTAPERADKPAQPDNAGQAAPSSPQAGAPDNAVGISPEGVTTRVDVPAQSTEEQYGQSCLASKAWMDAMGGDPKQLVEPYLKELQTSNESGPATFNQTWADLSSAQQAAVIIAVRAAADGGC